MIEYKSDESIYDMRLKSITLILLLLCVSNIACINTSYSRKDEIDISSNELDLILGQFAHHGEAFYESEVLRTKKLLIESPQDFTARNDLGSAYTKLGRYSEADLEFKLNEKYHPGKYETASNLGVLYKKWGKYPEAAAHIQRALEIKPGGHMNLGDYYLRMIQWLADKENPPQVNFLGISYEKTPKEVVASPLVNKENLITLIKNDYQFADVYVVLGDVYFEEKNMQYAMRCYVRAYRLDHYDDVLIYNSEAYEQRIDRVKEYWSKLEEKGHVYVGRRGDYQIEDEIKQAKHWLEDYQKIEKQEVDTGRVVDFARMKIVLKEKGIDKPVLLEAGYYEGEKNQPGFLDKLLFVALMVPYLSIPILLVIIFLFYKFYKFILKKRASVRDENVETAT